MVQDKVNTDYVAHRAHCNQGDYKGSCKYNDAPNCPALLENQPLPTTPKNPSKVAPVAPECIITAKDALAHHYYRTIQSRERTGHIGWVECDYNINGRHMFINLITDNRQELPSTYRLIEVSKEVAKAESKMTKDQLGIGYSTKVIKKNIKDEVA